MRWVLPENITSDTLAAANVTAGSEVSGYPVENLQTLYPGQFWRSGGFFRVTTLNRNIDVNDPTDGVVVAVVATGSYTTGAALATAIATALNTATSTPTYSCTYNSTTGKFTISRSPATNFVLLWSTGANAATSIGGMLGFDTSANDAGAATYTGDSGVAHLEDYITFDFGAASAPGVMAFFSNSFSSSADIRVYRHSTAISAGVAQTIGTWLTANATLVKTLVHGTDFYSSDNSDVGCADLTGSSQYWTIWFQDKTPRTSAGYTHQIGRLFFGSAWSGPTRQFDANFSANIADPSQYEETFGGILTGARLPPVKVHQLAWTAIPAADREILEALFYARRSPTVFQPTTDPKTWIYGNLTNREFPIRHTIKTPNYWEVGPLTFRAAPRGQT
jgi:hypothetical protein